MFSTAYEEQLFPLSRTQHIDRPTIFKEQKEPSIKRQYNDSFSAVKFYPEISSILGEFHGVDRKHNDG